jgi:hypothetical protein
LKKIILIATLFTVLIANGQQAMQPPAAFQQAQNTRGLKEKTIFSFNFFDKLRTKRWMHEFRNVFIENHGNDQLVFNNWEAYYNITERQQTLPYCNELRAGFSKPVFSEAAGWQLSDNAGVLFVTINDLHTLTTPQRIGDKFFALMPAPFKKESVDNIRISYFLHNKEGEEVETPDTLIALEDMENPLFVKASRKEYLEALMSELKAGKKALALDIEKKTPIPDSTGFIARDLDWEEYMKWKMDSIDYRLGSLDSLVKMSKPEEMSKPAMLLANNEQGVLFSDNDPAAKFLVKLAPAFKNSRRTDPRFITILMAYTKAAKHTDMADLGNAAPLQIQAIAKHLAKPPIKKKNEEETPMNTGLSLGSSKH